MKIKTHELTGAALDWAVAQIEIAAWAEYDRRLHNDEDTGPRPSEYLGDYHFGSGWTPSTDWSQGGPIIEREIHNLFKWNQIEPGPELWCGVHNRKTPEGIYALQADGPTPLVAAMRCFVSSRLGDEVDVPDELTE